MKRILVTGAGGSAAYNFVDCLRMADEKYYIVGIDISKFHLPLTKVDKKYLGLPVNNPRYINFINKITKKEKIDFLHPQPDVEVNFIAKNRDKFKTKTFLPSFQAIEDCHNKMKFNQILQEKGISVPKSFLVENKQSLKKAMDELSKDGDKIWVRAIRGAGSKASLPVKNSQQANAWIEYWIAMKGLKFENFMVCEFLPGKEFAFQSIWKDGQLITSQARERIEYIFGYLTPSGQTSSPSVAKTVHRNDVNQVATKAILAVDSRPNGIYCVDIKENKREKPCITEINIGRFFTTSNFFATAGVNMPHLYIKAAFDEPLPKIKKYNPIPANWYWVRMLDMGNKLVKPQDWNKFVKTIE